MTAAATAPAEHIVTGLTEHELLAGVDGTVGDQLPDLPGHQIYQLVDHV